MQVYLEITNLCNRNCSFCPGTRREKVFVPLSVIRSRLQKLVHADELFLHLLGEPLLHPEFREIAEACRKRGIPVTLTTNGTLLSPELEECLLSNPVFRQINFSLQALQPEETSLLKNILDFCVHALEKRPELYLNLRMWNLDREFNIPDRDKNFLRIIHERLGLPLPERLEFNVGHRSRKLQGRLYLHCGSEFQWPVSACDKQREDGRIFCYGLQNQYGILADGSVVPCCLDSEGAITLGNMDKEPLEQILSSPRAEAIRQGFRCGNAVEELCRNCTYRERFS